MMTFILFTMLLIMFGGSMTNPKRIYHGTNTPPKEAPTRRPSGVTYTNKNKRKH